MKLSLLLPVTLLSMLLSSCSAHPPGPLPAPMPTTTPPPLVGSPEEVLPKGTIDPRTPVYKVALLLPLSGDSMAVGNSMLDAANMALYDSYLSVSPLKIRSQIILIPKDTGNNTSESVAAAQQAVEQGAQFFIGPLFSQSVTAIAPMARDKHIGMLTFSNNRSVANEDVYVFGFLPEQQIIRMAEYAYLHGIQRVALLAPNDAYGQKVKDTLTDTYVKKGGTVAPSEVYAPSPANIDAAVSRMATAYFNVTEDKRFQAIFIADGGMNLKNIINSIKKTSLDLKKVKLIGTGQWDDPEVAKMPEMQGAWYTSADPDGFRAFEKRFTTMYGYKPVRLASLAYDAVALAATASMPSASGVSKTLLTDPRGFNSPANGMVRLRNDGITERPLAIFEIENEMGKVIDIPPANY